MSTYRPRGARSQTPEGKVLSAVLMLCRYHPKVAWVARMNVGAFKFEDRFIRFGAKGWSDIVGQLKDGRFLALETKAPKGQLTIHQEAFLARVREAKGVSGMVRSADEARAILEAA